MFNVNGHGLYWERYGPENGRPVLLLHHGLGSIRAWNRQLGALVHAGWNVLVYDRWGYGRSDPRPEFKDHFLESDADEALGLLESFGIQQVNLVGHSDGGTIALMLAADYPQLVERLVVVAAHIYIEPKMEKGLGAIAQTLENMVFIQALGRQHGEKAESLARAWVDHWYRVGQHGLDITHLLPKVECPTLVIQGEMDEHATPKHAHDIAESVKNAQLWLIPGVGHMPPHEVPENFNQIVLGFLEREPLPPGTPSTPN
jgi:pimeloyl-ACP methyl ester carboxylesterase